MHWRSAGEIMPDPQATRHRSCSARPGWTIQAIFFPGVLDRGDW
jgi:hypothetical protein